MIEKPNDGGAAFPKPQCDGGAGQGGMTLREYFAGQALAGLMAADANYGTAAEIAVKQAKALIAELQK